MFVHETSSNKKQEAKYYTIIQDIFILIQQMLCRFLLRKQVDQISFIKQFQKIHKNFTQAEFQKYVPQQMLISINKLARICGQITQQHNYANNDNNQKNKQKMLQSQKSQQFQLNEKIEKYNNTPIANLYKTRYPKDNPSQQLKIIGQQTNENNQDQLPLQINKRMKSGTQYKKNKSTSSEYPRPITSIRRNDKIVDLEKSFEYNSQYHKNSNTGVLSEQKKLLIIDMSIGKKPKHIVKQKKFSKTLEIPCMNLKDNLLIKIPLKRKWKKNQYKYNIPQFL